MMGGEREAQERVMAAKTHRIKAAPKPAEVKKPPSRRDEEWDERLRLTGDARFVDVEWSGRDDPAWPLPKRPPD
jgi:hypothetical protein